MLNTASGCRLVAMALVLGTSYREFESRHPDHFYLPDWYNGITAVSKTVNGGSIPSSGANKEAAWI